MAINSRANTDVSTFIDESGVPQFARPVVTVPFASSGIAASTFTRPADTTAYVAGDLIANSVTPGSVQPLVLAVSASGGRGITGRRMRVKTNSAIWKGAIIRVHLFRDQPTVAVGDNGVLNSAETYAFTESEYIGFADVTLAQLTSDNMAKGFASIDMITSPPTGNIFALLESRSAITPTSASTFTLALELTRS